MIGGMSNSSFWLEGRFVFSGLFRYVALHIYRLVSGICLALGSGFLCVTVCQAEAVDKVMLDPVVFVEDTWESELDEIYAEHLRLYARRKYASFLAYWEKQRPEINYKYLLGILEEREVVVNQQKKHVGSPEDLLALKAQYDARIRAEFGDEIADGLASYLEAAPARGLLSRVNLLLVNMGQPMTAEQMELMSHILTNHRVPVPRDAKSVAAINTYLEERHAQVALIMEKAAKHLNPRQTNVLAQEMEFQISFAKMGILRSLSRAKSNRG